MATLVTDVELVWRQESGWNVLMRGADGSHGHRIPIMDYLRWLHLLYQLPPNQMFGEPPPLPLIEMHQKPRKKRVVKKTQKRRRKR